MQVPRSGELRPPVGSGDVAVLIPLRSLRNGKSRLGSQLDPSERGSLIHAMANRVMTAAFDLPVLVVHDDDDVAGWATHWGAESLRPDLPGLNAAVEAGYHHLTARKAQRVIVAHADLPHARDLRIVLTDTPISIAPDRHRDGTNVLSLPTGLPFRFCYGNGSFAAHVEQARSLGLSIRIVDDPQLAYDLDDPHDLNGLDLDDFYRQEPL